MQKEKVAKGKEVQYEGYNRTYLKQYPKAVLTGAISETSQSAMVEFLDKNGKVVDHAWVGFGYIKEVTYAQQDVINTLTTKRDDLLTQVAGIDAAIDALKALG
jgi:hypothetical protein